MESLFPSYSFLFELTKRRLRGLKKIASKNTGKINDQDAFLFMLIGNINLRLNTICFLMENNISDGVYALQRTIYELQLAFEAYSKSYDKDKFLHLYFRKKDYETTNKWEKLVNSTSDENSELFSEIDKEIISVMKDQSLIALKESTKDRPLKVWYELASEKSTKQLSNEYLSDLEYFASYDEPSNWVHPQRLEENMSNNFNQYIDDNYFRLLIGVLRWDVKWLAKDIVYITNHLKISQSQQLFEYGKKLSEYDGKLRNIILDEKEG